MDLIYCGMYGKGTTVNFQEESIAKMKADISTLQLFPTGKGYRFNFGRSGTVGGGAANAPIYDAWWEDPWWYTFAPSPRAGVVIIEYGGPDGLYEE